MHMTKAIRVLHKICDKFSYISLAATFFLMCMTTIHVILRKGFAGGVTDSLDLTAISMVAIVFCSLAYLQAHDGHVRVNMFADMLPPGMKKALKFVLYTASAAVLFIMCYAAMLNIGTQFDSGAQTQVLKIPIWPFVILTFIGLLLYAINLLLQGVMALFEKEEHENE
jgi:TRAP-type C4-dicarboxylate transport system permease small subunit